MNAINPIKRNDAGLHNASRQTAARSEKRINAENGLNFADVLARVTGNDNPNPRVRVISGNPVISSLLTVREAGMNPIGVNAAYIRAGADSHALGNQYKVPVGPSIYDFNSH